jgi:hypothetical protein
MTPGLNPFDLSALVPFEHLRSVERASGTPAEILLVSAVVMFAAWTGCYIVTIRRCFRDRTYGFPIANVALNVSWEFIFAFGLMGPLPAFFFPLTWGHRCWLVFDAFNVYQVFKYGRAVQTSPWIQRWFRQIAIAAFAGAAPVIFLFMRYFNDLHGVAAAVLIDLLMAILFLRLYATSTDMRGLSYAGAWLRTIGDASSFVFLFFWWPAQFANGTMLNPEHIPRFENIQEPRSFAFLNTLYVLITALDLLYIWLLASRRRALAAAASVMPPRPAVVSS